MKRTTSIRTKIYRISLKTGLSLLSILWVFQISPLFGGEPFPSRAVTVIVPQAPGSGVDSVARAIQPYAQKSLGVPIILENVPGADARIGMTKTYKAKPDGYTFGIHGYPAPIIHEYLFDVSYKALNFSFIFAWTMNPQLIFVSEGSWENFDEFLLEARKRTLTLGVPGLGTVSHLMALVLQKNMNIKFNFVPYPGSAEGLAALAGKHIDANIGSMDVAMGMTRAKKVRPILIWSFHPDSNVPEVPMASQYNIPTIVMTRGIFGPPSIPEDRVQILEKAFAKAASEPKLVEWVKTRGADPVSLNSKQFKEEAIKQQALVNEYKELLKVNKE